jgi:hypothetical protein
MKRITLTILVVILALSSMAFTSATNRPNPNNAFVYVIHGINGLDLGLPSADLPVDVLANDAICLLQGFTFGAIAGPVELAPATYNLKISIANPSAPCSNAAVIEADVPFAAGEVSTVIAHLTEAGAPTASKFVNDISRLPVRMARLAVRHTAAAPTVDILVETQVKGMTQSVLVEDLSNPNQAGPLMVPARSYSATIFPANSTTAVAGPIDFTLKSRKATFIYAVGTLANGTFGVIVHELPTLTRDSLPGMTGVERR